VIEGDHNIVVDLAAVRRDLAEAREEVGDIDHIASGEIGDARGARHALQICA
jgi:hypothetical protein